ncbi:hypothetical protein SOVF_098580 [Spinacia oleracea]|uniref:Transcription factor TCP24-like n=1 Tax=Spinacia oleracea TaxID=3562 RepID=A0A9R0JTI1_SPIOL|nr:transcription factor TCP24-like [Spinacia oleracea]XP_021846009.1 transcription factor TCP24-like [Spinacia oleracea]KNA15408.1 hypothetical protein SOVF_098580 [Spinacia oleracea]
MRTSSAKKPRSNNKIYTARGPKDRRIRLSADIAIQFFDVQDRLGYDRATEAVDWLISKAKGSIDKLFDSSVQQQSKHLTHLESMSDSGVQVDFLPEIMSSRKDYGTPNFHHSCDNNNNISAYNCTMENSMFLPCIQMENISENQGFAHPTFSSYLGLEDSSRPCFQQIEEIKGQNARMVMFNSKSNSRNGEHPFISDSLPLFLQASNNDSSLCHSPTSDPELNLCLPGNCTSAISDSGQGTFF